MTRTIILVRHGKACSLDAFEKDIDRVLTQRGVNDGYKVAGKILESGYKIDLILSSPAARASHSALIFARSMNLNAEKVRIIDSLYHGSDSKILDILNDLPEEVETVAVFSHNPGITDLAEHLTRGATSFLPTTGVAIIDYEADDWSGISDSAPAGYNFIIPREIN